MAASSAMAAGGSSGRNNSQLQIQTLNANGNTIQYVTDGNPEQAAAAVLQAVFGTSASSVPIIGNSGNSLVTTTNTSSLTSSPVLAPPQPPPNPPPPTPASFYYQPAAPVTAQPETSGSGSSPSQIVAQSGNTYLVQSNNIDTDSAPITHTTRASPITVQWLLDNYETAEGVSLPRCALYYHYLKHCKENSLEPVNAASFGKLIRSVFLGLKTRRLGTRGNSKYHYYGIRIKPGSPLNNISLDFLYSTTGLSPSGGGNGNGSKGGGGNSHNNRSQTNCNGSPGLSGAGDITSSGLHSPSAATDGSGGKDAMPSSAAADSRFLSQNLSHYQQYLGTNSVGGGNSSSLVFSPASGLHVTGENFNFSCSILPDDIREFELLYTQHCQAILDAVASLKFFNVEPIWHSFWKHNYVQNENMPQLKACNIVELESRLPLSKKISLSESGTISDYVKQCDEQLYQQLVELLISDVLRPIPSPLTQAIRNFAKNLEAWMRNALDDYPANLKRAKLTCVCAFSQTLRRYTSLNHLAQAARAVLQNSSQINQMLHDLNRVDFNNVQDQASWVCGCEDGLIKHIEQDFKRTLQSQHTLEQWAMWLEGVVDQVLDSQVSDTGSAPSTPEGFTKAARQFLLKWSFYSSMVIRDLTLRSAASFGSFHLIRLLYDEYMFFLIEHRISQALGKTPIAVMGQCADEMSNNSILTGRHGSYLSPDKALDFAGKAGPGAGSVQTGTGLDFSEMGALDYDANYPTAAQSMLHGMNLIQRSGGSGGARGPHHGGGAGPHHAAAVGGHRGGVGDAMFGGVQHGNEVDLYAQESGGECMEGEDFEECESDTEDTIDMTRAELSLANDNGGGGGGSANPVAAVDPSEIMMSPPDLKFRPTPINLHMLSQQAQDYLLNHNSSQQSSNN